MNRSLLFFLALFSIKSFATFYDCKYHPEWPNNNKFSATFNVMPTGESLSVTMSNVNLSKQWPFESNCDSPLLSNAKKLDGVFQGKMLKLWLPAGKMCSFTILINTSNDSSPSMLLPIKSTKENGARPYLAKCTAI